jgi:AraC family transcriptional regulator
LLLRATMQDGMGPPPVSPRPGLLAWQIQRVLGYIETHLDCAVGVADLAQVVKLSEAHFSRMFWRTFREPPHLYLARRRIEYAGHLLLSTDAPLREISLQCGFCDQAHFSKRFRQFMGEAPGTWRRRQRSGRTPESICDPYSGDGPAIAHQGS